MTDNSTPRPPGLDDLLDHVVDQMDPVEQIRRIRETVTEEQFNELVFKGDVVVRLLDRVDRYEKNKPSWAHGTPEDYDAWLRELTPDDRRLMFYQWIGGQAVTEAVDEVREILYNDPIPVTHQHYDAATVGEFLDVVDPAKDADPFPSQLPLGRPFCDDPHHIHTHGGSRLPSCSLTTEE
jgi:hypothetical protein